MYYVMENNSLSRDWIEVKKNSNLNEGHIHLSEKQYFNKDIIELEVDEASGTEYPDLLTQVYPIFSNRLKEILEEKGVHNIYFKPVYIVDEVLEEKNLYWLGIVEVIECLDKENSVVDRDRDLTKLAISKYRVGNYEIFKVKDIDNELIIVSEDMKNFLISKELDGLKFINIKNYNY